MVGRVPATKSFNVLIVGSPQSGKTCVFKRFESGSSPEASLNTYEPSVSVQEATNMIASPDGTDKKIRLKMVDTPGEDKFRRQFTSSYYCSAHAVLLVYDMGNKSMWEKVEGVPNTPSCQEWVDEIEHCAGHPERCVRFLIGTKVAGVPSIGNFGNCLAWKIFRDYCSLLLVMAERRADACSGHGNTELRMLSKWLISTRI